MSQASTPVRPAVRAMSAFAFRRRLSGLGALPNLAVAAIPTLVAVVAVIFSTDDPFGLYGDYIVPLCIYFVIPFMSMFTMLPILGELYEQGAMAYVVTRPVPRWAPLLGLFQGSFLAMLPTLVLSALLPGLILAFSGEGIATGLWLKRVGGLVAVLTVGGFSYGAVCLFLGVWSRRSILWALGLLIGWGAVIGGLPGDLRTTSPHRYLMGLADSWCKVNSRWSGMFTPEPDPPGVLASLTVLGLGSLAFFALAWLACRRRDIL